MGFDRSAGRILATKSEQEVAKNIFNGGAIICEHHTDSPLAVSFLRKKNGLGVGWLPGVTTNRAAWVELLVTQWAESDKAAFPSFGDWTEFPEWMVTEEEQILSQILALERKKRRSMVEIDRQIGELTKKFILVKANINMGRIIYSAGGLRGEVNRQ